jgi:repressor LexA
MLNLPRLRPRFQIDKPLTPKQKKLLHFIEEYIGSYGQPPDLFQIKDFLGLESLGGVHRHMSALELGGHLRRDSAGSGLKYALAEGKFSGQFIKVPMVGTITAGQPIDAIEVMEDFLELPLPAGKEYFALKVRGDSMQDMFIEDGDSVVIARSSSAQRGDVVVALTSENQATLKQFFIEDDGRIRLQPANSAYEPQYYQAGELEIQGVLVSVV